MKKEIIQYLNMLHTRLLLLLLLLPFIASCSLPLTLGGAANSLNGPPTGRTLTETVALRRAYLASHKPINPILRELHDPKARLLKSFEMLGAKYAKRYRRDLIERAVIDIKKMSAGRKLIREAQQNKILGSCIIETSDKEEPDDDLLMLSTKLTRSYIACDIKDSKALQNLIKRHSILFDSPVRNKVNYWWAYIDVTGIPTWRQYFYLALFEEYGLQPAIGDDYIVLGYFLKKEDALALQQAIPELDIKVAYVIYEEFEILKVRPKRKIKRRIKSTVRHKASKKKKFRVKKVPLKITPKGTKLILKETSIKRIIKPIKKENIEVPFKLKKIKRLKLEPPKDGRITDSSSKIN